MKNLSLYDGDIWIVDCDAEINVTFKIGGQSYPIHPLDVTQEDVDSNGNFYCYGTVRVASQQSSVCWADNRAFKFQPMISESHDPTLDAILGMTFCKQTAASVFSSLNLICSTSIERVSSAKLWQFHRQNCI